MKINKEMYGCPTCPLFLDGCKICNEGEGLWGWLNRLEKDVPDKCPLRREKLTITYSLKENEDE